MTQPIAISWHKPTRRQWCIAGTPTAWSDDDVQLLIREQTTFTDIRGGSRPAPLIPLTPTSLSPTTTAPAPRCASGCFLLPRVFLSPGLVRPSAPGPRSLIAKMPLSMLCPRAPEPSTKKAPEVVRIRRAPQGTQLRKVEGDGNCFHSCVAHALQPADPAQPGPTAAVIRAQTCAHMTKYTESYSVSTTIGKECTRSRTMFGECRPMLNSWAGGLELLACAPAHRICIVMLAERPDLPPCCFNPKPGLPRGPRIALWYTKDRYDLLQPPRLPKSCLLLCLAGASVRGIPRAGADLALLRELRLPLRRPLLCETGLNSSLQLLLRGLLRPLLLPLVPLPRANVPRACLILLKTTKTQTPPFVAKRGLSEASNTVREPADTRAYFSSNVATASDRLLPCLLPALTANVSLITSPRALWRERTLAPGMVVALSVVFLPDPHIQPASGPAKSNATSQTTHPHTAALCLRTLPPLGSC